MIIDNLQINADLENVLEELQNQLNQNGIPYLQKLKQSGNDIMCQCPYHKGGQERKLSAGIRKDDGVFHCFACGETHSLQEVISYCFGRNDAGMFGWRWLVQNFGTVEREERKDVRIDFSRNIVNIGFDGSKVFERNSISNVGELCGERQFVSEKELNKYRYYHPYWEERKITDESIIELFDLGYSVSDHCITFPVRDIHGRCLFVAKRSVKTKFFHYPLEVEKPLYGLYELELTFPDWNKLYPDIIVCESMIDALTCWQWGKYAVATNGTQVSELQFKQLRDLPCRKLILAMDNDEAGREANERIRKYIKNKLLTEYIFPDGKKDINELTKKEFENLQEVF